MSRRTERILIAIGIIAGLASIALGTRYGQVPVSRPTPKVAPPTCLSPVLPHSPEPFAKLPAPYAYIPPATMFGLKDSWRTISSGYADESGLIGWMWPVADSDFMLPCGAHEVARLPGDSRDKYVLAYTGDVIGSGLYESWRNGNARFAFLHLVAIYVTPGQTYAGGTPVGLTGWPTAAQYANNDPGPQNAHLCVVYEQNAKNLFYSIRHRPAPFKQVFPSRKYESYRTAHHLKPIPYLVQGRLARVPFVWWHVKGVMKRCGGVKNAEQWHAKRGYEEQDFERCHIFTWPRERGNPYKVA